MADKIILSGLEIYGRHGCTQQEKVHGQIFVVDAELETDIHRAAKSDNLADAIDYVEIFEMIKKIVGGRSRNLIETVAAELCEEILENFPRVEGIKVTLRKPNPPIGEKFTAAVEIYRNRQ